jgi:hypothetical protein
VSNHFPCPYCKGNYSWVEPVLDDGSGPTYECGFCDKGMIEIGSEKHKDIKRNNPPKDFMWEWIGELGCALDEVIDALEHLPESGWSERENLLKRCRKAKSFSYEPR